MFADKTIRPVPTNTITEVKGGLGDILMELFTPPGSPKQLNQSFPSEYPATSSHDLELRAKNELIEHIRLSIPSELTIHEKH